MEDKLKFKVAATIVLTAYFLWLVFTEDKRRDEDKDN